MNFAPGQVDQIQIDEGAKLQVVDALETCGTSSDVVADAVAAAESSAAARDKTCGTSAAGGGIEQDLAGKALNGMRS